MERYSLYIRTYLSRVRLPRLRLSLLLVLLLLSAVMLVLVLEEEQKGRRGISSALYGIQEGDPDPEMIDMMEEFNEEWANQLGYSRKILHKNSDIKRFSLYVANDQIDHFKVKLPPLLDGYRNPCWLEEIPEYFTYSKSYYSECALSSHKMPKHTGKFKAMDVVIKQRGERGENWRVRCFPYFFLLGVPKCATQDLYTTLLKNVDEFIPGNLRELHFWDYKRCADKEMCKGANRPRQPTFADYLDTYDGAAEIIRRYVRLNEGKPFHPMVIGDMTPSTMAYDPCWPKRPGNQNLTEPRYITAHYIYSIRPQTKFVLMLREPADRLYSNYMGKNKNPAQPKFTADNFHAEAEAAVTEFKECLKQHDGSARACSYIGPRMDFMRLLTKSLYDVFLNDWLSIFPREQFFVVRLEDYQKNKVYHIKRLLDFLGIKNLDTEQETNILLAEEEWKAQHKLELELREPMRNDTKQMLHAFFRPFNHRLAAALKDKRYTWDY